MIPLIEFISAFGGGIVLIPMRLISSVLVFYHHNGLLALFINMPSEREMVSMNIIDGTARMTYLYYLQAHMHLDRKAENL